MTSAPPSEPSRSEVDALSGATVLEFGAEWCGYCRAAQPLITSALSAHPELRHIRVEDGKGKLLGRTFRVKLWPTLVFMRDGHEISRVVRPMEQAEIDTALAEQASAALTLGKSSGSVSP